MASVESLELQIVGDAQNAQKSLDALIKTLERLKAATKGGCGLSTVSKEMHKVSDSESKVSSANTKSAKSFVNLSAKITVAAVALKKAGQIISSWIKESNDYVENLNLFTVAMGEYAESAQTYAETVSDAMGIDPSDWMRNQGVFMTLGSGFGMATDRAAKMSQQLTQLGYDLSSFFNISVADSMQKLQSGISGELEPLRRLGYDLSQAKLEAIALSLGIDKAVSSMTQAEKAELRYYAIMTQVTTAQGDMSRTLDAPANQLRILSAQATQAARSLGNIFIPALNAVLPYAIAFLKVIREIANNLANLFGFSLPEIDYSGVNGLASGSEDASDALDEAADSAKKLKKTLLGIDELNVLSDKNSSGSSEDGTGGSFDFALPEYDFMGDVSKRVDKVYKTVKKLLKPVEKLVDFLVEYKEIVLLGVGILAVTKLWAALKSLWAWIKTITFVDWFLNGFSLIRATGGTVLQSIRGGFDSIRMSLSTLQKTLVVAVAGFVEFTMIRDAVRDLAMGCDDVGGKIVTIGVVATAAGAAMYAALGPAGLAIAAIVGLVGAIVGVNDAQNEMLTAMSNEAFYSGTGAHISDIADAYGRLMESIVSTNQPIIDNQANIDSLRDSVTNTEKSIDGIARALSIGSATASEEIEEIKELFGQLKTDTKTIMDDIYNNIVTAIGGSFGEALIKAGQSIPEVMAILQQIRGEGVDTLTSLQTELDNLTTDLESGKITQEEFGTRWLEIEDKMNSLIGVTDEYTGVFANLKDSIGNINWGDEEQKNNFFSQVTASSAEAKDSINQASDSIIENLETMKNWTTDENLKAKIDDWITIAESDRERQLKSVDDQLTVLYDAVQEDMIRKATAAKDKAVEEWNDMNWFQRWWNGGSETGYVRTALQNYRSNVIQPISDDINTSFETLGVEGETWANDAMGDIIAVMFDPHTEQGILGIKKTTWKYVTPIEEAIEEGLGTIGTDMTPVAEATGTKVATAIGDGVLAAPLSPIADDFITTAFDTSVGYNHGYTFGQNLASGITKAIKNTSLPTLKGTVNVGADGTASIKFKAYAMGGFPSDGEIFIANEAGPELVGTIGNRSAVVNNDQIVESVSKGVYQAVSSAMGSSQGSQVVEAKVNDKVLFEVVVSRARQEAMRTGSNPLLGGV